MKYRILGVVVALLVLVAGTAAIVGMKNRKTAESLAIREQDARARAQATAEADRAGGTTPAEALRMLADAVGRGDGPGAAALAVPALRDHIGAVVAGMTADMQAETARQLRESARSAPPPADGDESYVLTEPVYVELIRYPSGAWKVASF